MLYVGFFREGFLDLSFAGAQSLFKRFRWNNLLPSIFFTLPRGTWKILDFPFWAFSFFAWFLLPFDHTSDKHLTKEFFLFSRRFRSEIDSEKGNKRKGWKEIMEITSTKRAVFIFYVVNWNLKLLLRNLETSLGDVWSSTLNRPINFCYLNP